MKAHRRERKKSFNINERIVALKEVLEDFKSDSEVSPNIVKDYTKQLRDLEAKVKDEKNKLRIQT